MAKEPPKTSRECYFCDFDGTMSVCEEFEGPLIFGPPVPKFVKMMQQWLKEGIEVVVFTARVDEPNAMLKHQIILGLQAWCKRHVGQVLEVTCIKSRRATKFFDDRNVCIERNTGKILGECNVD